MHEGRLRQLNDLLPRVEASAARWHAGADEADALVRDTKAAIVEETREHRHLRPLIFIPGGFGIAAALRAWHARPRGAMVAVAGGSATVVAAGAIALAVIVNPQSPTRPRPSLTTGTLPTVEPLPPAGHWPPPTGPPKGPPPKIVPTTPPAVMPSPTPGLSTPPTPVASAPPVPKLPKPQKKVKLPHTPPGKPPKIPPPVEPPVAQHRCVLTLLDVGLLCDRSLITGVQSFMWPSGQTPTI